MDNETYGEDDRFNDPEYVEWYMEQQRLDYEANANNTDDDPLDCNPNLW